ncbi:spore coat protein [Priestia flexa]|uniref:spore coat protein n=1 Tax=Priestia flexa TaxID=86664 RepID=UPI000C249121|nr:spore coat protein [Priestia flexa]MEC0665993.1 spore coat protein [Priestia flexa]MED3825724.1 spore coat protein [Priestia flexa]
MNNEQTHMNMHTGKVPQVMNHGGHELFDVHETLAGMINVLDQFMMFRQYIQDEELKQMLDRQYSFILEDYNRIVESFSTGQDPSSPTQTYNMAESNDFVYGLKASQPKKPSQSINDISDKGISGHMLGLLKGHASLVTMTSLEITNPIVRRLFADSVPNWIEMAYEVAHYQNKRHDYQVPQLAAQDVQQMTQSFAKSTQPPELPNNKTLH